MSKKASNIGSRWEMHRTNTSLAKYSRQWVSIATTLALLHLHSINLPARLSNSIYSEQPTANWSCRWLKSSTTVLPVAFPISDRRHRSLSRPHRRLFGRRNAMGLENGLVELSLRRRCAPQLVGMYTLA